MTFKQNLTILGTVEKVEFILLFFFFLSEEIESLILLKLDVSLLDGEIMVRA